MEIIFDIAQHSYAQPKAVTVGFFDGVHIGHRFLIRELQRVAAETALKTAIITFSGHPRKVLHPDYCPQLITTNEEKMEAFTALSVDYCYILPFTSDLAAMPAKEFMKTILKEQIGASVLLIGYDHRFGKDRSESFDDYVKYGDELGIKVIAAPRLLEGDEASSSSAVRRLILAGKMREAAALLARPYQITGVVAPGHKVGREIGFPTANLQLPAEKILPPEGVYAVNVRMPQNYGGMLYIGKRPTLNNGEEKSIEVNIFDFIGDIYGCELTIEIVERIRDDIRFDSVAALKKQLEADKGVALSILKQAKNTD